jgi:hypothetical protein
MQIRGQAKYRNPAIFSGNTWVLLDFRISVVFGVYTVSPRSRSNMCRNVSNVAGRGIFFGHVMGITCSVNVRMGPMSHLMFGDESPLVLSSPFLYDFKIHKLQWHKCEPWTRVRVRVNGGVATRIDGR